ncbi:hypothetical protein Pr1d_36160 [Bythopirellula goksoeyrii]|uniref:Uncharacterized protein n=2 Tax=Bythopirellula goksoeyrii TaxID=1400387 RepID=A0A5B9QB69_9BACT|nr:hypothetical protein Pr1d_36160 [Bythopirellula goksoeyrii]
MVCVPPVCAAIWNVSSTSSLVNAVDSANWGDEIVLASGTYNLPSILRLDTPGVTVRGATGNRDDVVLVGGGMNNDVSPRNIFLVENEDITIRDLTVSESYWNGIQLRGETNRVNGTLISNVKIMNIGQRYIKGSKGSISDEMRNVTIENSYLLQTKPYVQQPGVPNDYIGGIDAMITKNWTIRDNVFEGIHGLDGEGRGAVFLWQGGENALIERNIFINNDRSIALGNWGSGPARDNGIYDMDGAIIRNNTVLRYPAGDIGMELVHTKDVEVFNNTFYSQDVNKSRLFSVLDHGSGSLTPTTGLDIQNNIIRGQITDSGVGDWSAAAVEAMGNLVDLTGVEVLENWFVDPQNGDLHLTNLATGAIGHAPRISSVFEDIDGNFRPDPTDYGADQFSLYPGDFNGDEIVDDSDLPYWQAGYGLDASGDADNDSDTDGKDFLIWQRSFQSGPSTGLTAIPEPSTVIMGVIYAIGFLARRPNSKRVVIENHLRIAC